MITFKGFLYEETYKGDKNFLLSTISKYKIPKEYIGNYDYLDKTDFIIIDLPAVEKVGDNLEKLIDNAGVLKLYKDVKSGKFKHDRLVSVAINDFYSNDNSINLNFAVLKPTSKPKKLYHWTKKENVDAILKNGLEPRTADWGIGSTGKTTYKAIFLVKKYSALSKEQGFKHYKRPAYELLEIEVPSNLDLYKDPHHFYGNIESYMVFDKIDPKNISKK